MTIPTWRTQAAPDSAAALKAVAEANKQQSLGMATIAKSIGGGSDAYGDIVKNEAYNILSNVIPGQGESRAAARQRTIDDPENKEMFDSSFLDMDTLETTLSALDASKKKIDDENILMNEIDQLESIDPAENPRGVRDLVNRFTKENRLGNVADPNNRLKYYGDELLRDTPYTLDPGTIADAGGIVGSETTYTPDVVAKVRKKVTDQVRSDNLGASETAIEARVNKIFKESEYGAAFTRGIDYDKALTPKDRIFKKMASKITDASDTTSQIAAINEASRTFAANPQWDPTEADFLTQPIIRALNDMTYAYPQPDGSTIEGKVDPLKIWRQLGLSGDGRLSEQRIFLDEMYKIYRSKFTELPKKVIDQKIRQDIADNGTISTVISAGNTIAELKADKFKKDIQQWNDHDAIVQEFFLDGSPVENKTGDALLANLEKKYGKTKEWQELKSDSVGKLYKQVQIVSDKIKKAFTYKSGKNAGMSTLKPWHEDTLDLAIFRMLSKTGGYDANTGFMNLTDPDFTITTIDPNGEMAKADANILVDELQRWLPKNRDRTPEARKEIAKDKGASFDQLVNQYLNRYPPVPKILLEDPGKVGPNVTWEQRKEFLHRYVASVRAGGITNFVFNPTAIYEAFNKKFGWEDPKGSTGEKVMKQLLKEVEEIQRMDQTRVNSAVD
jgi:hypothetical protein